MNLMNQAFCQCCGMPMTGELHGTNAGGGRNEDYCKYCFKDGAFTFQGSMEEMIQLCVPHMTAANPGMSEEEQLELLASDGMLVKRPILVGDDFVLVGFREAEWSRALDKK